MLALLDDESLKHPALECVFTVQEEVGLNGAMGLDKSILKAKKMIGLDIRKFEDAMTFKIAMMVIAHMDYQN